MDETRHRQLYRLQAWLLGPPACLAGGGLAAAVVYAVVVQMPLVDGDQGLLMLLWAVSGLAGLLCWAWASGAYLRGGRHGLRWLPGLAWAGLGLGAVAALAVLGVVLYSAMVGSPWRVLAYLVFGPPLLLPTAHLAWLRWSRPVAGNV